MQVNGVDLTHVSHLEAVRCLSRPSTVCQLTVYREPYDHCISRDVNQGQPIRKLNDPPNKQFTQSFIQWTDRTYAYIRNQSVNLSVCQLSSQSVSPSVCQSVCMSVSLSIIQSVCESFSLSVPWSVGQSACQSVSLSVKQSASQSVGSSVN